MILSFESLLRNLLFYNIIEEYLILRSKNIFAKRFHETTNVYIGNLRIIVEKIIFIKMIVLIIIYFLFFELLL
jgi:hypothetical protein